MIDSVFPLMHTKSLKEQAYELLRSAIIAGRLDPGSLYNETDLAQRLGVSRTPVREALLELSREGMVIFVPQRCYGAPTNNRGVSHRVLRP